jgi:hypothetical protein
MSSHSRFARVTEWAEVLTCHLSRHLAPPHEVEGLIAHSVLRHLDSAMLVEDSFIPFREPPPAVAQFPLPTLQCLPALEAAIRGAEEEGFGVHFHRLMGLFGHIMLTLSGSAAQNAAVASWIEAGLRGAFLMTDRGGPSLASWTSELIIEDKIWHVTLDKVWSIGAHDSGFAIAIVRRRGAMVPTTLLLSPEICLQLTRTAIGLPFLDGSVQLGDCKGHVVGDADWALTRGGLAAVKQFLTMVRPRFVRALMAHMRWLVGEKRAVLSAAHWESMQYLTKLSGLLGESNMFTRHSEDEVMALKFACNALLSDIVEYGAVPNVMDERDLLGFTKMEGSSYRCFYEIYSRSKGLRDG